MAVSNEDILKLRQLTGAGIMDCKRALEEAGGDSEKAVDILRKKGIEVASRRESKTATEGVVASYLEDNGQIGVLVEVNCETDFAARSDDFREFAGNIAMQIADTQSSSCSLDELLKATYIHDDSLAVEELLNEVTGKLGERVAIRRFVRYQVGEVAGEREDEGTVAGTVVSYIHAGEQIGVLVEISCETPSATVLDDFGEFAHNIAMQIAAMQPKWVSQEDVPQDALDREREILSEQAKTEGKPEHIVEKMVEGRLRKFYSQVCLLNQPYIRDDDITIEELLNELTGNLGERAVIRRFTRYQVGEEL